MKSTTNASELVGEPRYLPLPRELLAPSSDLAAPDIEHLAKVVLDLALGNVAEKATELRACLSALRNIHPRCKAGCTGLTEKQVAYDRYFAVNSPAAPRP